MKTEAYFSAFIFLFVLFNHSNKAFAQSTIKWSENKKLTWKDFKGSPDKNIIGSALTTCKIEIQPVNVLVDENGNIKNYKSLKAVALFFPELSWVRKKKVHLLIHEQLHFDIVELYTRKLNRKFEELKDKKIARFESYLNAYKSLWAECRKIQQLYDQETDHGLLVENNQIWVDKIKRELNKLKEY